MNCATHSISYRAVNLECLKYKWPEYKYENIDECSTLITEAFARAKLPTKDDLEALDKRIGDIGTIAQILGVGTGIFGILITVLVIYFSINEKDRMEKFIYDQMGQIKLAQKRASNAASNSREASSQVTKASTEASAASEEANKASTKARAASEEANIARVRTEELLIAVQDLERSVREKHNDFVIYKNNENLVDMVYISKELSNRYIYKEGRDRVKASEQSGEITVFIDEVRCIVMYFNDKSDKKVWGELILASKELVMKYKIEGSEEIKSAVILENKEPSAASPLIDTPTQGPLQAGKSNK